MTVQELIDELQKVEDKGLPVTVPVGECYDVDYVRYVKIGKWPIEDCSSDDKPMSVGISVWEI